MIFKISYTYMHDTPYIPYSYLSIQFRIEKRNILEQKEKFQDKTPILQDNTNNSRPIIISFPGVQFIILCSYANGSQ